MAEVKRKMDVEAYDVVILGQGAAAYAAALYSGRYRLETLMIGQTFGGETATASILANYPGYVEVDGFELMSRMKEQVDRLGVKTVQAKATAIAKVEHGFDITYEGGQVHGETLVYAVGRERRKLGLPGEESLWGVSYCATCDAPLYAGKTVAVIGGGDSAVKAALLLSRACPQVYVVYRGQAFARPEAVSLKLISERKNIVPVLGTRVTKLLSREDALTGLELSQPFAGSHELAVGGVFVEIGAEPRSEMARALGVALNEKGEVMVDKLMETNLPRFFGAGDVCDGAGDLKQTITAAAQGALAATSAYKVISIHGNACEHHCVPFEVD